MGRARDTKVDVNSIMGLPFTSYFILNSYVHLFLVHMIGVKKAYIKDVFVRMKQNCVFSGSENLVLWERLKYKTKSEFSLLPILREVGTQYLENPEDRAAESATKETSFQPTWKRGSFFETEHMEMRYWAEGKLEQCEKVGHVR